MRQLLRLGVLPAIHPDHQALLQADEIDGVRPDWMLPAEARAIELTLAPRPPRQPPGVTRLYALFAGLRGVGLDLPDRMKA